MRELDRTVGRGLVALLGAMRRIRPRSRPIEPQVIGVMKTVGIGDMVLASAVIADLRARYPRARIVAIAGPGNAGIARLLGVDVVTVATARPWSVLPALRSARLDMLIDLGQWTRLEAIYSALSGASWTVGFSTAGYGRHHAYDQAVPHRADRPELENFRALVRAAGATTEAPPALWADTPPVTPVANPYAVLHLWPGGFRSELREWPIERWRALAARLVDAGLDVVLTGGAADVARAEQFVEDCRELAPHIVSVAGQGSFEDLLGVLRAARCVISVNTGTMHVAAAAGARTIALNGPTASRRWGPVGPRTVNVDSTLPGCGFLNLGFEYEGQREDCMEGISVEQVAELALETTDA